MRAMKGADTTLELAAQRLAHSMGYRFRLHRKGPAGEAGLDGFETGQGDLREWLLLARS
jgi:hypothetical protein